MNIKNGDELERLKEKLMEPYWTEDLHLQLEELEDDDAKKIVESMSETEIFQKVNHRRHQEDYISDYIEYLWDISEDAYWKHIETSLYADEDIGLLWSDNMSHVERMCQCRIPENIFNKVLIFIMESEKELDLDALSDVIKSQVNVFSRYDEIEKFANQFNERISKIFLIKIELMLKAKSIYEFHI